MYTREITYSKPCTDLYFSYFEGLCNVDKTALSGHFNVYFQAFCSANLDRTATLNFINAQLRKFKEWKILKSNRDPLNDESQ